MEETLTGTTTPSQSGPRSKSNEGVVHIPQSSWTRLNMRCSLVSCPEHLFGSYLSTEIQLAYSTAPADWANVCTCVPPSYIYIYIYISFMCVCVCIYIYIYIDIARNFHKSIVNDERIYFAIDIHIYIYMLA